MNGEFKMSKRPAGLKLTGTPGAPTTQYLLRFLALFWGVLRSHSRAREHQRRTTPRPPDDGAKVEATGEGCAGSVRSACSSSIGEHRQRARSAGLRRRAARVASIRSV